MPEECKQEKRIENLEGAINGNGQEGMKVKLARVEEGVKRLSGKMNFNNWLTFTLLAAIISIIFKGLVV